MKRFGRYQFSLGHVFTVLLGLIASASVANYMKTIEIMNDDLASRQAQDFVIITRLLDASLPVTVRSKWIQSSISNDTIANGDTTALISVVLHGQVIADNDDNLAFPIPSDTRDLLIKTATKYTPMGERQIVGYGWHKREYMIVSKAILVGGVNGLETLDVYSITDLTAATASIRSSAAFLGVVQAFLIFICYISLSRLTLTPLKGIADAVKRAEPIRECWWYPVEIRQLGASLEQFRDESARYQAEADDKRKVAEQMAEELQVVNHIAMHDIKADLTALNMGSEVIRETVGELIEYVNAGTEATPVVTDALETITYFADLNTNSARNAFDVLDQRNKLFDLANKIELKPCKIDEIFTALTASFASTDGELILLNECPQNRSIYADYSLLLSTLKNIVRNGFIHNDSTFKIVSVCVGPINGRSHITITDNGVGMPESYLTAWGKSMGKSAQLSDQRGGSGTGLYSIRNIVEAHKGATIAVTSVLGKGTTFTLEFDHVK